MMSLTYGAAMGCTLVFASMGRFGPVFVLFSFPGTVAHELAHYLVALTFGAKPTLPRLWPRRQGPDWILGSVTFVARWFSAGLIALAPAYLLPAAAWASYALQPEEVGLETAATGYVTGLLLWGAAPSRVDWGIVVQRPLGPLLVLLAAASIYGAWPPAA